MNRYSVEAFRNWMGDALIRRMEGFEADGIALDGSVRIAAFDENWKLKYLHCCGTCPCDSLRDRNLRLFAVDQLPHELHFAVRRIGEYRQNVAQREFCFGANARIQLRVGNMNGLKPLLERVEAAGIMTLADVYCIAQESIEEMWRRTIKKEKKDDLWTQENCLQRMRSIEGMLGMKTKQIFAGYGLCSDGEMRIEGISMPLLVQEY